MDWRKKSGNSLIRIQRRIGCSTLVFNDNEVKDKLIELEIIKDRNDPVLYTIIDDCGKIQRHSCSGCNYRRIIRKGEGDDDVQCRYRDYFAMSAHPSKYMYFPCNPNHSGEAIETVYKCDLLNKNERGKLQIYIQN